MSFDDYASIEIDNPKSIKLPSLVKPTKKSNILERVQAMRTQKANAPSGKQAKNTKWRQKSEQFRNAMRAAR